MVPFWRHFRRFIVAHYESLLFMDMYVQEMKYQQAPSMNWKMLNVYGKYGQQSAHTGNK